MAATKGFPLKVILTAIDRLSGPVMHAASTVRRLGTAAAGVRGTFASLGGRLGLPVFNASMNEANKHFGKFTDVAGSAWRAAQRLGIAVGIAAGAALYATNSYAEYTGVIYDQVKVTGLSAESLQAWGYAAKQNGTEASAFYSAMKIGSKNIGLATIGQGKAKEVLRGLGIQLKDTTGEFRSMDSLLPEIADKIKRLRTPQLQAAAAAQIFGKSGADMLPFLLEGSDGIKALSDRARELGLVLSNDAIDKGDQLGDTIDEARGAMLGMRNTIMAELAPTIILLARQFTDFVVQNRPQIQAFATMLATNLPTAIDKVGASFAALRALVEPFVSVLGFLNDVFGVSNLLLEGLAVTIAVKLVAAVTALTPAVIALGTALLTTPIGWIIAGLTAISLIALAVYNNWDKVKQWWVGFIDWLVPKIEWLADKLLMLSPAGLFLKGAKFVGGLLSDEQSATAGAEQIGRQAAGGKQDTVKVTVDLNNLPAGSRVATENSGTVFDLNQGYVLAAP